MLTKPGSEWSAYGLSLYDCVRALPGYTRKMLDKVASEYNRCIYGTRVRARVTRIKTRARARSEYARGFLKNFSLNANFVRIEGIGRREGFWI